MQRGGITEPHGSRHCPALQWRRSIKSGGKNLHSSVNGVQSECMWFAPLRYRQLYCHASHSLNGQDVRAQSRGRGFFSDFEVLITCVGSDWEPQFKIIMLRIGGLGLVPASSLAIFRLFFTWFLSLSACESVVRQPENWQTQGFCEFLVGTWRFGSPFCNVKQ